MTAQPQYPGYPPQQQFPQYPQAPAPQQFAPPQGYPAQPQFPGFPQAPAQQAPQQPAVPLAQGSIDDFYNQPSAGGGPSISWAQAQIGTSYAGVVARDVSSADIVQQTNFTTKQPEFYKDGRPKFVMKVPLRVQQGQQFPDGEATLFVRGQMRDELVRAMAEAGAEGAPKAGAGIVVTLVGKRQSGQGLNPANVFQIQYTPPTGQAPAPQQVAQPQAQPTEQAYPAQPQAAPTQQSYPAQPQFQQLVPTPGVPAAPSPAAGPNFPAAPSQAPAQQVQPGGPQPPSGLTPEQQQLLASITGGQQG